MDDQDLELVKAIAEGTAAGVAKPAMALFNSFAREVSLWAADKVRARRYRNLIRFAECVNRFNRQSGLKQKLQVSFKLGELIVESASLEDEPELTKRWAALLLNAVDPSFTAGVLPSYTDALKRLTPESARILDALSSLTERRNKVRARNEGRVHEEMWNMSKVPENRYRALVSDLESVGLIEYFGSTVDDGVFTTYEVEAKKLELNSDQGIGIVLTRYGWNFLEACMSIG